MWVLIAGNLMSMFVSTMTCKLLIEQDVINLSTIEKLMGWFLISHIPETYTKTAMKFFIINEEFRNLITNFLLVFRNIFTLSYSITSVEFFHLMSIEIYLFILLALHLNFLSNKKDSRDFLKRKDTLYASILFMISLRILFLMNQYSSKFFSIPFLVMSQCLIHFISNYFIWLLLIIFIYNLLEKNYLKYKIKLYFIQFIFIIYFSFDVVLSEIISNNNFINELCIKALYFYILIINYIK